MDILHIATAWAKAEVLSSKFFVVAALLFIALSVGFWQLGRTEIARAYITPMAVCGGLLLIIGVGLIYNNQQRLKAFPAAYTADKTAFIDSELKRTEATIKQTEDTIFRWIPILIVAAALLIIFIGTPAWRAACITAIAMLIVLLVVDSNSHARIVNYDKAIREAASHENTTTTQPIKPQ